MVVFFQSSFFIIKIFYFDECFLKEPYSLSRHVILRYLSLKKNWYKMKGKRNQHIQENSYECISKIK